MKKILIIGCFNHAASLEIAIKSLMNDNIEIVTPSKILKYESHEKHIDIDIDIDLFTDPADFSNNDELNKKSGKHMGRKHKHKNKNYY